MQQGKKTRMVFRWLWGICVRNGWGCYGEMVVGSGKLVSRLRDEGLGMLFRGRGEMTGRGFEDLDCGIFWLFMVGGNGDMLYPTDPSCGSYLAIHYSQRFLCLLAINKCTHDTIPKPLKDQRCIALPTYTGGWTEPTHSIQIPLSLQIQQQQILIIHEIEVKKKCSTYAACPRWWKAA